MRQSQRRTKTAKLVAVHLVDAIHCSDPYRYISVLLLSLKAMLQLDLPHINVLSKIDLLKDETNLRISSLPLFNFNLTILAFKLSYYTDVQDLSYLLEQLNEGPSGTRFKALNSAVCELVEDFGLVHFEPLYIEVLCKC